MGRVVVGLEFGELLAMVEVEVIKELPKAVYHRVLDYAVGRCGTFLLVTGLDRSGAPESGTTQNIMEELRPWLVREERSSRWPGTMLYQHEGTISYYRLDAGSVELLKARSKSLYDWAWPMPDDLCLMRDERVAWLTNTAHERMAMWVLTAAEAADLLREVKRLADCVQVHEDEMGPPYYGWSV